MVVTRATRPTCEGLWRITCSATVVPFASTISTSQTRSPTPTTPPGSAGTEGVAAKTTPSRSSRSQRRQKLARLISAFRSRQLTRTRRHSPTVRDSKSMAQIGAAARRHAIAPIPRRSTKRWLTRCIITVEPGASMTSSAQRRCPTTGSHQKAAGTKETIATSTPSNGRALSPARTSSARLEEGDRKSVV